MERFRCEIFDLFVFPQLGQLKQNLLAGKGLVEPVAKVLLVQLAFFCGILGVIFFPLDRRASETDRSREETWRVP